MSGKSMLSIALIFLGSIGFSSPKSDSCRTKAERGDESWTDACALRDSYDFIIIGGGTAGSILANRLSEVPQWSVLLLEAGKDETYESKIPFFPLLLEKTSMDWNYTTTRQKICKSVGGYCKYPRGRALGGSSSINYMLHMRGLQEDFNRWEREGNPGWSYNHVASYFKKSENFIPQSGKVKSVGRGGPLPVNENEPTWMTAYLSKALQEMGLQEEDLNLGKKGGFMPVQVNVLNGQRVSASTAFLKPILNRPNLDILTSALVTRIVFEKNTAVGVEFEVEEQSHFVSAHREVILSAGSINSPQILMLSGVGPSQHLQEFGIPVIRDLPVGLQLQDHVGYFAYFQMKNVASSTTEETLMSLKQYLTNKTGWLSTPLGGLVVVLRNSSFSTIDHPDMQFHLGRGEDQNMFYMNGFVCHPESRGRLSLRSNSPRDPPLIDPNYLNSTKDMAIMREIVEFIFQLALSTSLRDLGTAYLSEMQPGCNHDFVNCVIRQYSQTFFHPVATCKMAPQTDPYAVVDSNLQVYGVRRLRVVDASVIPNVPTSNINSPTMMVAEKASDMIKQEHLSTETSALTIQYHLDEVFT
uniref:Glucose dehydrogenase [acceptor] n=2 Tax=Lygus hesperus TaxID=30085 RepID=A0A0A9XS67_LYGHE